MCSILSIRSAQWRDACSTWQATCQVTSSWQPVSGPLLLAAVGRPRGRSPGHMAGHFKLAAAQVTRASLGPELQLLQQACWTIDMLCLESKPHPLSSRRVVQWLEGPSKSSELATGSQRNGLSSWQRWRSSRTHWTDWGCLLLHPLERR